MMNYFKIARNFSILFLCYFFTCVFIITYIRDTYWVPKLCVVHVPEYRESDENWNIFIQALISVESGGNDFAVGFSDDTGSLQITPVYLEDANRILGYRRYELSDRFNRQKSIEMFNIINDFYNPGRDFNLALKIHNPRAPLEYHLAVINKYKELKNE